MTFIAEVSIKGCHTYILCSSEIVSKNVSTNEMINLRILILVFDNNMGRNNKVYPINVPIHAVGNQNKVFVYTAQVYKSRQIENRLVAVKTSSFFDLKKDVNVGIKE